MGFHPGVKCVESGGFSSANKNVSPEFLRRIKVAYRLAVEASRGTADSMWTSITEKNRTVHEALVSEGDDLAVILANPGSNDLFYGFDNLFRDSVVEMRAASIDAKQRFMDFLAGNVVRLGEALGSRVLLNPEGGELPVNVLTGINVEVELDDIQRCLGAPLEFPNPFQDEFGIKTKRGIVSYRAVQAVYQVFRLRQMANEYGNNIVELGAGLGRTGFYCNRMGMQNYTIVDLPMANVAQAAFLGLTLGEREVSLYGEKTSPGQIRIRSPEWLHASDEKVHVVANIDSMVEMDLVYAEEYGRFVATRAKAFLSINHEANKHRVRDLPSLYSMHVTRFPYWMRDGYVEEIYVNTLPSSRAYQESTKGSL